MVLEIYSDKAKGAVNPKGFLNILKGYLDIKNRGDSGICDGESQ
jgi:hypothetical protein